MRTNIFLKSVLVLIVLIWHASFASANMYSNLKVKVWLSSGELQIQFTEEESKSTVLINIGYDRKVSEITSIQHDSLPEDVEKIHPAIRQLVSGIDQIKIALLSVSNIENVEAINLNGPPDLVNVDPNVINAKWDNGVFLPSTFPQLEHLNSLSTQKEKYFYRLGLLLNQVSKIIDPQIMERQSDSLSSCEQYVAQN